MFDFYDPDAYTRAQDESFSAFRAQKEQLFQRFPWIQIQYGEINVLQGPGYWVSWFKQYYRAPNLSTEGIRRLYWQPVKNGELKIVGMEWLPQDLGMERAYSTAWPPVWWPLWKNGARHGKGATWKPTPLTTPRMPFRTGNEVWRRLRHVKNEPGGPKKKAAGGGSSTACAYAWRIGACVWI